MKALASLAVMTAMGLAAPAAHAVVTETFNYNAGVVGNQAATGTGLTGNWGNFVFSNNVSGNSDMAFIAGSLSAPAGYALTPTNNRIAYDPADSNNNGAAFVELAPSEGINFGVDGTVYASFLLRAFNNNGTEGTIRFLTEGGAELFRIGELGSTNGQLSIQTGSAASSLDLMDTGSPNAQGVDNLVVLKIETSAAGTDQLSASFWMASETVTGEPTTWDVTNTLSSSSIAQTLFFRVEDGFANLDSSFDEFRMGASFEAVTGIAPPPPPPAAPPVPEPASIALASAAIIALAARRRR